jgi:hypothetical protein
LFLALMQELSPFRIRECHALVLLACGRDQQTEREKPRAGPHAAILLELGRLG